MDPRLYQIAALSSLLLYGLFGLDFDVTGAQVGTIVAVACLVQWLGTRACRLPHFEPRSALISALSLCLLMRTHDPVWWVLGPAIAVGSKFVVRARGRHVFNPTNLGLVVALAASDRVWVSPGQWGDPAWLAFLMASVGMRVVTRAARSDVTLAFFGFWLALLFGRALWLGDPLQIPVHQAHSGALLLFGFFMISDPRTTPASRAGRITFAGLVCLGAFLLQFHFFRSDALFWSLAAMSPIVPLLDRWLPGPQYQWAPAPQPLRLTQGVRDVRQPVLGTRRVAVVQSAATGHADVGS